MFDEVLLLSSETELKWSSLAEESFKELLLIDFLSSLTQSLEKFGLSFLLRREVWEYLSVEGCFWICSRLLANSAMNWSSSKDAWVEMVASGEAYCSFSRLAFLLFYGLKFC